MSGMRDVVTDRGREKPRIVERPVPRRLPALPFRDLPRRVTSPDLLHRMFGRHLSVSLDIEIRRYFYSPHIIGGREDVLADTDASL